MGYPIGFAARSKGPSMRDYVRRAAESGRRILAENHMGTPTRDIPFPGGIFHIVTGYPISQKDITV